MISVIGNKKIDISKDEMQKIACKYTFVVLDMGCGDGRFVYKNAAKHPNVLYIGLDPAEKQLEIYSKKSVRKKLTNAFFIVGSIENIPNEIFEYINHIFITLPWGTLLESVIKPNDKFVNKLEDILKDNGKVEIIFGYVPELEPSETKRLNLPTINKDYVEKYIVPILSKSKLRLLEFKQLDSKDIGDIETTWAKKLKFGRDRTIFKLIFTKN